MDLKSLAWWLLAVVYSGMILTEFNSGQEDMAMLNSQLCLDLVAAN